MQARVARPSPDCLLVAQARPHRVGTVCPPYRYRSPLPSKQKWAGWRTYRAGVGRAGRGCATVDKEEARARRQRGVLCVHTVAMAHHCTRGGRHVATLRLMPFPRGARGVYHVATHPCNRWVMTGQIIVSRQVVRGVHAFVNASSSGAAVGFFPMRAFAFTQARRLPPFLPASPAPAPLSASQ